MPLYRFTAISPENTSREGFIEAATQEDVIHQLRKEDLTILRIMEARHSFNISTFLKKEISFRRELGLRDLAQVTLEWGTLVDAGVTIEEALRLSKMQLKQPKLKALIEDIYEKVKGGASLYEALSDRQVSFPQSYTTMIHAAETAGTLGESLRRMASELAERQKLSEEIRNALLYPIFLLVTASAAIIVLLVIVVPNLENIIGQQKADAIPTMSWIVIGLSHVLRDYGVITLITGFLVSVILTIALFTPRGRAAFDAAALRLPVLGRITRWIESARFMRTCGSLIRGGIPLARAMPLAAKTVVNVSIREALNRVHGEVLLGAVFSDALSAIGVLPEDSVGLIRAGERTGQLAFSLEKAAEVYEGKTQRQLKALTTMLAPSLTMIFGAVAGIIVYAMMSTILSINELVTP